MYRYKDTIRYPRLVAEHFNTFDVFKNVNGGSEDESFEFFKHIFSDPKKLLKHDHCQSSKDGELQRFWVNARESQGLKEEK